MTGTLDHQVLDPGQSRPRLRTDLIVLPYDNTSFVIEDPLSGKFFLVGMKEWSFISQLDGAETIAVAVGRSASQVGNQALNEQEAISVARWLVDQGLARPVDSIASEAPQPARPGPQRTAAFNPLAMRLPLGNPERLLSALAPGASWLWSRWFLLVWLALGSLAITKLAAHATDWRAFPLGIFDPQNWLRMLAVWCVLKLFHEFAHGLASTHFGAAVRKAGILFLLLAPLPYVDVSAAWRLASPWRRIVISAAGMYVELLLAFGAILAWTPGSLHVFDRLCIDIAILASVHTLAFNLNPLMRFDGYYILADSLGIPNLYSEGQQRLSNAARYWFGGVDVASPSAPRWNKRVTFAYGLLSFLWRCFAFAGAAIGLVASWSWWGLPAVVLLWGLWFGWPLAKRKKRGADEGLRSPAARARQRLAWGGSLTIACLITAWIVSPAHVMAPAVVEYAPLTVLRAKATGFVAAVYIQDGETVEPGQLLLELANDDLAAELAAAEIGSQQARVRSRWHYLQGELSKHQSELAAAESLDKRRDELRAQLDGLKVRAPCSATVVTHGTARLLGTYVEQGASLVTLGSDCNKELLVSVAAGDEDDFRGQLEQPVDIYREQFGTARASGRLTQVEPRSSDHLPHAALGADAGGNVVVRPDSVAAREGNGSPYLALDPRSVAKVALDPEESRRLQAGLRVNVGLRGASQSWGQRLIGIGSDYLKQLAAQAKAAEGAPR